MFTKAIVTLEFNAPHYQCKFHSTEKLNKELHDAYEKRTFREKLHINEEGYVIIPAMMLKNCIANAAKFLSMQIPGKGKSTYTKHFEAGLMVTEDSTTMIKKEDAFYSDIFLPADGVRGSGKRVLKRMPFVSIGTQFMAEFIILDETITKEVFEQHLRTAGQLIGMGSFRPRQNGNCGRFKVVSFSWEARTDA